MMTLHEVAEHYGVSDAFMVRALDGIGFKNAEPDSGLPTPTVTRFEVAFGDKIRAAQPKPPHLVSAESDTKPAAARSVRQPKPPARRVAHAQVNSGRDAPGHQAKRLLESPGLVTRSTRLGRTTAIPGTGRSFPVLTTSTTGRSTAGRPPRGGWAHMRAVLGDEFVPADDPAKAGQCPRCATTVSEGKGFRTPAHEREHRSYFCEAYLRLRIDGSIEVQDCSLRDFRRGPHRTREGATCEIGFDDHVPAPLDANRRITKGS